MNKSAIMAASLKARPGDLHIGTRKTLLFVTCMQIPVASSETRGGRCT